MCGLAGCFTFSGSNFSISKQYLISMRDTMVHRGPDAAGVWIDQSGLCGLAHRRLSIVDLSDTAHQPMTDKLGRYTIVFNGEIYNHNAIRQQLMERGHREWRTDHSDTEVLLRAFQEWGIGALEYVHGMFAFAVWDSVERELWLVRDRIGIKPLYFSQHANRIIFASEIKALLKDPDQAATVNEEAFFDYLSFLTTPAPKTLFKGIQKLPAGTWMRVRHDGTSEQRRYWDSLDNAQEKRDLDGDEYASCILDTLESSVEYRNVSDVPVGAFLSGGVDSSSIAALMAKHGSAPVNTFSVAYSEEYPGCTSEMEFVDQVVEKLSANSNKQILSPNDLIDFLPKMIKLQDEPIADPVCVPVYYLSALAKSKDVTVVQVGEGADELFFGYPAWGDALNRQKSANKFGSRMMMTAASLGMSALGRDGSHQYELMRRGSNGLPLFWSGAESFYHNQIRKLLSPRLRKEMADYSSWDAIKSTRKRFEDKAWEKSDINWMTYADLNLRLPELLLMRVDKMAMGASVEARVPFLDHRLVELAMSIPSHAKYHDGQPKRLLKRAVRGLIPDSIIDRPKQGFGVPVQQWFSGPLGKYIMSAIDEVCDHTDLLDRSEINRLLQNGSGTPLWFLGNFALWWKEYIR